MFAAVISAQKTPNIVAGAPLGGIDIKLGRNPGGGGQARKTDKDGKVDLSDLAPGSYWLEIVDSATSRQATLATAVAVDDHEEGRILQGKPFPYVAVTISGTGLVGGTKTRSLKVSEWKFVNPPPKNAARTATPVETYTQRIEFEIGPRTGGGPPEPLHATIIKSKSNITNN
jgi:hypothetical protein